MPTPTVNLQILQKALSNDDTFATTLLAILMDEYGTPMFDWDPQSLWLGVYEDFGVKLPNVNKDKVQALTLVYTTDLPFVSVEAFMHVANVLSGSEASFNRLDVVEPIEALWAIYEMMLHVGLEKDKDNPRPEFSHEILRFLGVTLRHDGMNGGPDLLGMAEMDEGPSADEWADDPEMFNAIHDLDRTRKADVLKSLGLRLVELAEEMNIVVPALQNQNEEWPKFKMKIEAIAKSALASAVKIETQARS